MDFRFFKLQDWDKRSAEVADVIVRCCPKEIDRFYFFS